MIALPRSSDIRSVSPTDPIFTSGPSSALAACPIQPPSSPDQHWLANVRDQNEHSVLAVRQAPHPANHLSKSHCPNSIARTSSTSTCVPPRRTPGGSSDVRSSGRHRGRPASTLEAEPCLDNSCRPAISRAQWRRCCTGSASSSNKRSTRMSVLTPVQHLVDASARRATSFRVLPRTEIQCFRRSGQFVRRVRFPAAPP